MKAITVCNPYPELILRLEKPIENRNQHWSYRGPILLHAGKSRSWMDADDYRVYPNLSWGAIVGSMNIVACLELESPKPWPAEYAHLRDHEHANGDWCLILSDVRRFLKPIECNGALGLWDITKHPDSDRIVPLVREQLAAAPVGMVSR